MQCIDVRFLSNFRYVTFRVERLVSANRALIDFKANQSQVRVWHFFVSCNAKIHLKRIFRALSRITTWVILVKVLKSQCSVIVKFILFFFTQLQQKHWNWNKKLKTDARFIYFFAIHFSWSHWFTYIPKYICKYTNEIDYCFARCNVHSAVWHYKQLVQCRERFYGKTRVSNLNVTTNTHLAKVK